MILMSGFARLLNPLLLLVLSADFIAISEDIASSIVSASVVSELVSPKVTAETLQPEMREGYALT